MGTGHLRDQGVETKIEIVAFYKVVYRISQARDRAKERTLPNTVMKRTGSAEPLFQELVLTLNLPLMALAGGYWHVECYLTIKYHMEDGREDTNAVELLSDRRVWTIRKRRMCLTA
jgi:hypothetical protein